MNDYGVLIPLWDELGLLSEDEDEIAGMLGLSPALIADLMRWQEDWENRADSYDAQAHIERGGNLLDRVRREARPGVEFGLHA